MGIAIVVESQPLLPSKVFMEHAIGEGLVLDIFKEVLLQTLPEQDETYDMSGRSEKTKNDL